MYMYGQKYLWVQYSRKKEQEKLLIDEEGLNAGNDTRYEMGEANVFLLLTLPQRFLVWVVNKCKEIYIRS